MHSCIYQGNVRHRRFQPLTHEFCYSIAYLYVDLAEWDHVIARLPFMSQRPRWSVSSLCREDHLGDPQESLDSAVRGEVQRQTGSRPSGPVRMLSQWRTFGYFFSPVNFFFCFDPTGVQVESVVAEVNNTPWGEQHCYVLWQGNRVSDGKLSFSCKKEFHVSPFMALDLNYRWSVTDPSDALTIHIQAMRDENRELDSTLRLRRYELSAGRWLLNVARYPLIPPRILAGVYFEALRLWLKKAPYYPHPNQGASKGAIPPRELMPASEQPVVSDKSLDDASSENERLPAG